ncbi:MAG: hypothetical protein KF726_26845 [Anaerolineae bacterium]|nr:hypothetical protein [Anaerolineae bacterium]
MKVDLPKIESLVQVKPDDNGEEVIQLPLKVWQDFIARLKQLSSDALDTVAEDESLPQHVRLKAWLQKSAMEPDDKSPEWWDEFDQFMRDNRPTFPERDLGFGDE